MMKKLLFLLMAFSIPCAVGAQSLSVEVKGGSNNSLSTFMLQDGSIRLGPSSITFTKSGKELTGLSTYGISSDLSVVSTLSDSQGSKEASIYSNEGLMIAEYGVINFSASDPSLQVYSMSTGGVLVRDNVITFNVFDSFGNASTTISSGGQSTGGQVVSEVAMDPNGKSIVIYTPKLKNGGVLGSSAGRIDMDGKLESLYFSEDRTIKDLRVSVDGQFLVIISAKEGADDQVLILDKFGNEINSIESSENLKGTHLSGNADYITVYSSGRAVVYDTISGERIGSTSFGSNLILAHYFANDEVLLGMSGNVSRNGKVASNLEFHAIHLGQRKVERTEYAGSLGLNANLKYHFDRTSTNRYQLKGANKLLEIVAKF